MEKTQEWLEGVVQSLDLWPATGPKVACMCVWCASAESSQPGVAAWALQGSQRRPLTKWGSSMVGFVHAARASLRGMRQRASLRCARSLSHQSQPGLLQAASAAHTTQE